MDAHTPSTKTTKPRGVLLSARACARYIGIGSDRFRRQIKPLLRPLALPGRPLYHVDDINYALNQLRGRGVSGPTLPADPLAARDVLVTEALRATAAYQPSKRR